MDVVHCNQKQLATRWNISEASLERWRCEGIGPKFLKICGRVLCRLADIDAYEESCISTATQKAGGSVNRAPHGCGDSKRGIELRPPQADDTTCVLTRERRCSSSNRGMRPPEISTPAFFHRIPGQVRAGDETYAAVGHGDFGMHAAIGKRIGFVVPGIEPGGRYEHPHFAYRIDGDAAAVILGRLE